MVVWLHRTELLTGGVYSIGYPLGIGTAGCIGCIFTSDYGSLHGIYVMLDGRSCSGSFYERNYLLYRRYPRFR